MAAAGDADYLVARDAVVTEFIPEDLRPGRYSMLMTNFDLLASPLIRYSGKLAVPGEVAWLVPRQAGAPRRPPSPAQ